MLAEGHSISSTATRAQGRRGLFSGHLKEQCRKALAGGIYRSGMLRIIKPFECSHEFYDSTSLRFPRLRRSSGSKFGILCYHRVGTEGVPFHSKLDPALFEAHMRYVKQRYRVVPLGQLVREMLVSEDVPPTLAITFDDGYRDLYIHAFPTLQKYQIPATIYLIGHCMKTGEAPWYDRIFAGFATFSGTSLELEAGDTRRFFLDTLQARLTAAWEIVCYLRSIPDTARQQWCTAFDRKMRPMVESLERRMLDWTQVRTMQAAGLFFGAHTMNHPAISQLHSSAFKAEFVDCKKLLETGLDALVEDFAYPFGKLTDGSSASQGFIARAGYRSAVTTIQGFNSPSANPYMLRRLQIGDECSMASFAFNLSRLFLEATAANSSVWSPVAPAPTPIAQESEPSLL